MPGRWRSVLFMILKETGGQLPQQKLNSKRTKMDNRRPGTEHYGAVSRPNRPSDLLLFLDFPSSRLLILITIVFRFERSMLRVSHIIRINDQVRYCSECSQVATYHSL